MTSGSGFYTRAFIVFIIHWSDVLTYLKDHLIPGGFQVNLQAAATSFFILVLDFWC